VVDASSPVRPTPADRPAGAGSPPLGSLFDDLVRVETVLWNALEARLRIEHGLTLGRFEVMRCILSHQDCRVQDITADLVITVGGASKLVDRIEAAGHCRRKAHPSDGRSSVIELTATGHRLLARAAATVDDELETRLRPLLPARALGQLGDALAHLRSATTGAPVGPTDPTP
jgi:DNA-binding MarR family transcriptional regulator